MIDSLTLFRYLGRQYLVWFFSFLFGLAGIIYLFEVAELMRRAADVDVISLSLVLRMGAYKLPDTVEKVLPFVVLFSGMFTFWKLTRSQELVIARAAGVSVWQFLAPALLITLVLGGINTALVNPVGATMTARYKTLEFDYFKHGPSLELTGAGLWLRQEEGDRRYLLHADKVSMDPLTLTPLIVFVYDKKDQYLGRIDAPHAVLKGDHWAIENAWFNAEEKEPEHLPFFALKTSLTYEKIQDSMASPETISFWQLPNFIRALKEIGLPPVRHKMRFHVLLAMPLLLCAMVLFAAAFSLRLHRHGGILNAMMLGVLVGSAVFSLNNVVTALGINHTLPIVLAAWAIPVVSLLAGQATLLYLEDG
ncbi:MAG: LPS export ABC transporter permease LptG [Bdellovibrionales bacterium]